MGEDAVLRILRMKLAKMVFVADNASANTKERFSRKCFFYNTKYCNGLTGEEMSSALGKPLCRILAVTDQGFADALMRDLYGGAGNEG
jgi:ribosomal protein L7Ae-like RNA K-turn-binding protein